MRRLTALRNTLLGLALGAAAGWAGAQAAPPDGCPPQAQPLTTEQVHAGMREARDRGFLWRISRDGRDSHLYGTLHIGRRPWMFPGPTVVQALKASDTVALELDMLDPDVQRRLAAGMRADPAERLPDALAERLRRQIAAACLPPEAMAALAPMMQLTAVTTLAARWDGLDPAYAVDPMLAGYARAMGKPVLSLETPERQLALLKGDAATAHEELADVLSQLERGKARQMLVRISEVWSGGQVDELSHYEQWCDCTGTALERAQLKRMLDDRNPALAERIDALHSGGQSVFAAVGALHLVGALGVPTLLRQRGYAVEQVELER